MSNKRARLYDAIALLTVSLILILDQWTKTLIVNNLDLHEEVPFPVLGHYFALYYIQNSGAAFSMLQYNVWLFLFIGLAVVVVGFLYIRIINTGYLRTKLTFGFIIGGAIGNLIDRLFRGGYVVDFVSFRIPELNFYFAIFNVADACISLGVLFLFLLALFGGMEAVDKEQSQEQKEKIEEIAEQPSSKPLSE